METPDPSEVQRAVGPRYEVLDLAGVGGMGAVFRARHRELGHLVAIKVLPPEIASSRVREERFRREAQLAAQLSHPNIVPVYEFDRREGITFQIMPFVRGRTLESLLEERERLPLHEVLALLEGVAAALDFAHQRGVVHRDVKPSNILVEEGTPRTLLADFGVALARPSAAGSLTIPGAAIGTPQYMAPEQVVAVERVDGRADLYALGIVAYEALTGALPTAGLDRESLAAALRERRPDVSSATAAALVAPLAERPADRPDGAGAWLAAVRQTTSRRHRLAWAVTLGLVALAGFALLLRPSRPGALLPKVAVMPFSVLGPRPYPAEELPTYFVARFSPVPELEDAVPYRLVRRLAGPEWVSTAEGDSFAMQLGARYFINASVFFQGRAVTIDAKLYETGRSERPRTSSKKSGPVDSIDILMDAVWGDILGGGFRANPHATIPRGKDAIAAFFNADKAFRRGDYQNALALYDTVVAHDPEFALAYLRRVLTLAQFVTDEDTLQQAVRGARSHLAGLERSDSLLLEGYALLVTRGDGRAAVTRFREAAQAATDPTWARFVAGEFFLFFGQLFDQSLDSARAAFEDVLASDEHFAAALANSISLAHLRGDDPDVQRRIRRYRSIDSTSIVAEVVGLADTLLFHPSASAAVVNTLDQRPFTVLVYLAFQAAQFGTDDERRGPARRVLKALARRARTDRERVLALRLGVAADLREGWRDSALARLRAAPPAADQERDQWTLLAAALDLPRLGDAVAARRRLAARAAAIGDTSATLRWLLALTGPWAGPPRMADSAPLPTSLALDLAARAALRRGDTVTALARWDSATLRYAVVARRHSDSWPRFGHSAPP